MSLTVIVPSRNTVNLLQCMDAVYRKEPGVRMIVIDDGLPPIMTHGRADVIPGEKPFIFARNCNLGIRAAGNDDVVLLNDDALLISTSGFTAMQDRAKEHPEFGVIGAVTNITGQHLQWPQGKGLREVPHFAFVCVLIPRRTIERVGYLDERYCLDYGVEDRDYCEACRRAGLKVGVYDGCFVDHGSLTSTFRGDPNASRCFLRNMALFDAKWRAQPEVVPVTA